ncbi:MULTISPECIES: hypothetical protein [unclassified Pseudonocardia]|uniref:hypothetical protein n=1 Tax=Pseudonocardia sp. Ae707_Ps1 TaxID=1885572 RepID=UPI0004924770|nr:hypothetical protein [Pseudonocardia sp. Ae707_Ps1]
MVSGGRVDDVEVVHRPGELQDPAHLPGVATVDLERDACGERALVRFEQHGQAHRGHEGDTGQVQQHAWRGGEPVAELIEQERSRDHVDLARGVQQHRP